MDPSESGERVRLARYRARPAVPMGLVLLLREMEARGLSTAETAAELGVTVPNISQWIAGSCIPTRVVWGISPMRWTEEASPEDAATLPALKQANRDRGKAYWKRMRRRSPDGKRYTDRRVAGPFRCVGSDALLSLMMERDRSVPLQKALVLPRSVLLGWAEYRVRPRIKALFDLEQHAGIPVEAWQQRL